MPTINPEALRAAVPQGRRLIGLDLGSKTIGLALSDTTWRIASALETIRRRKFSLDAERLLALADEHQVGGLVLGLPINMDGSEGSRCQSTRAFAANLLAKRDLPIAFQDERLSTAAVERMLVEEMDTTRKRRAEVVDKLAATYILQGLLDRLANDRRTP
ncbi:MAG: Holliday junction resolvase RuvX [Alphaproteobacteria bacterium]|jgi:putative Holliday junction resolvase|nr:Holliday junction resolvase RuvX [Alphaproteobacteria bacterium]MDP6813509.1 Holliday junction resolvase RuvX [Alphaproteobacteria bacterium]